ncbi:MAG: thiolase family protein [Deltaproteobacteria bacterium]|nr:thiolase family protein [Deltaproteobacteria bacterium]
MKFERRSDDTVIVLAHRSAVGRAKKGALTLTRPDDLLAQVMKKTLEKATGLGVPLDRIEDVMVGCAMPEGEQGLNVARISALAAGLPYTVSAVTVNRFCSSGIEAIAMAAGKVATGQADVILAGGVESMTMVPMGGNKPTMSPDVTDRVPDVYAPMGITAENVSARYEVTRRAQDEFAYGSHKKASAAIERKSFDAEIVPIDAVAYDDRGQRFTKTFVRDELVRPDTTLEGLTALKPAFKKDGTVTAGNSSPLSDGAAVSLVMSRKAADSFGLKPLGTLRGYATAGVDPALMGIGPVPAVRKLLARTGGSIGDLDVVEMNEAFAAQAVYCQRELGVSDAQLNPNGGAIAIGHPLGATGARMTATLLHELGRREGRFGIVTMCVGGGMGAAALFERG